jgi:hypothetical protein
MLLMRSVKGTRVPRIADRRPPIRKGEGGVVARAGKGKGWAKGRKKTRRIVRNEMCRRGAMLRNGTQRNGVDTGKKGGETRRKQEWTTGN